MATITEMLNEIEGLEGSPAPERAPGIYSPPPLYNVPPPRTIVKEAGWHRSALYMKAWGKSNREIAAALDKSEAHIGQVVRQPWFIKELVEMLHKKGGDGLDEMLRAMAPDAAQIAYEIMTTTADESLRAKSAFDLLKIVKGTKVLPTVTENRPPEVVQGEISRLEQDIKELEGSIKN